MIGSVLSRHERSWISFPSLFPRLAIRFAAEFDFRTFDPEGVVLYAESSQGSWFMLGLRGGHIEVQFKNQHTFKLTSGGKAINDGQWHVVRKGIAPSAAIPSLMVKERRGKKSTFDAAHV